MPGHNNRGPRYRRVVTYDLNNNREVFEASLEHNEWEVDDGNVDWHRPEQSQRAIKERNRRQQVDAFATNSHPATSELHRAPRAQEDAQDPLMHLLELFGALLDPAIIQDVFQACSCSFEDSLQVLTEMSPPVEEAQAVLAAQQADDHGASSSAAAAVGGSSEPSICWWDILHESEKEAVLSHLSARDLARVAWTCRDFAGRVRSGRLSARNLVIPTGVSLSAVLGMVAGHPNARAVSLVRWGALQLRDADFTALITAISQGSCSSRRAVKVEAISLRGWSSATDTNILTILDTMQHLRELDLSDCPNLTDAVLGPISRYQRAAGSEPLTTSPAPTKRASGSSSSGFEAMPSASPAVDSPAAAGSTATPSSASTSTHRPAPLPSPAGGLTVLYRADPNRTPNAWAGKPSANQQGVGMGRATSGSYPPISSAVGGPSGSSVPPPGSTSAVWPSPAPRIPTSSTIGGLDRARARGASSTHLSDNEEGDDYDVRRAGASDDDDDGLLFDEEIAAREQAREAAAAEAAAAAVRAAAAAASDAATTPTPPPRSMSRTSSTGAIGTPGSLPRAHGQGSYLLGSSPVGPPSILGASPTARSPSPSFSTSLGKGGSMGSLGRTMFSKFSGGGNSSNAPKLPATPAAPATPGFGAAATPAVPSSTGSGASMRGIEVLCLAGCSKISPDGVRALLQAPVAKQCLRALDVSRCMRMTRAALQLPPNSSLQVLKAAECQNLHEVLMQLPLNSPLQELWLNNCRQLTKLNVIAPRLTLLHVGGCKNLFNLQLRCPRLTQLLANQCVRLNEVDAEDIQVPCLEELNLFGCRSLTSHSLTALVAACPHLHLLNLNGCNSLGELTLQAEHGEVRGLDVSGCRLLTSLHVHSPQLTSLTARACHHLTTLGLDSGALTTLDLTNCYSLRICSFPALQPALNALMADREAAEVVAARPRVHPSQARLVADAAAAALLLLAGASISAPHVRATGCDGLPSATLLAFKALRAASGLPRPSVRQAAGQGSVAGGSMGVPSPTGSSPAPNSSSSVPTGSSSAPTGSSSAPTGSSPAPTGSTSVP